MAQVADEQSGPDFSRVISVINGKGGVLKTSIVTNVAGRLAAAGYNVLLIDLDISGNSKLDLGLLDSAADGEGRALVNSIWDDAPLPIVKGVRDNLDYISGGPQLEVLGVLSRMPTAEDLPGGSVAGEFARKLAQVMDDYDLIFLDCPPGNGELQDMALAATGWVLIPTMTDPGSWDGLLRVGPRVRRARANNPQLKYLGVVITAHNPSATRVFRNTQERLHEVGETVPLFNTFIRHSQSAAHDCRSRGQLAHELARDASQARAQRFDLLRERRRVASENVIPLPTQLSGTADSLAGDYESLAREITDRISRAVTGGTESFDAVLDEPIILTDAHEQSGAVQ